MRRKKSPHPRGGTDLLLVPDPNWQSRVRLRCALAGLVAAVQILDLGLVRALGIGDSDLLARLIAGIVMKFPFRFLAGLLLVRVFIVGHASTPSLACSRRQ